MRSNKSESLDISSGHDKEDYKYREKLQPDFGPPSNTGWDVVDKENYYNEPGFGDDSKMDNYFFKEIVDDSEPDLDMQELMDKYGFEMEWELNDYAKKCEDYLHGDVKVAPLKNEAEVLELAYYYRDKIIAESEDGLPLTVEERGKLSDKEIDRLHELFDVMSEFYDQDESDQKRRNFITDPKEHRGRFGNNTQDMRRRVNELNDFNTQVGQAQREIERIMAKARYQKTEQEEYDELMQEKAEYTEKELQLIEDCYNWLTKQSGAEQPQFDNKAGESLTDKQILDGAQEYAEYRNIPRTRFFEHNFKGKRQLSFTEKDKQGRKLKLIALSEDLPKGVYYYKIDLDNMWQSKKDPNMTFAKVDLLFSAERGGKKKGRGGKRYKRRA